MPKKANTDSSSNTDSYASAKYQVAAFSRRQVSAINPVAKPFSSSHCAELCRYAAVLSTVKGSHKEKPPRTNSRRRLLIELGDMTLRKHA